MEGEGGRRNRDTVSSVRWQRQQQLHMEEHSIPRGEREEGPVTPKGRAKTNQTDTTAISGFAEELKNGVPSQAVLHSSANKNGQTG